MNCTYNTFVSVLLTSLSLCLPASSCTCASLRTVCVGVCLCVGMCSLSDSISQGSRGSCRKVVALVSFAKKDEHLLHSPRGFSGDATCLIVAERKNKPQKKLTNQ